MFDQTVQASEAMREAASLGVATLVPALCGCTACDTVQMIAAPTLGVCTDCGAELTVLTEAPAASCTEMTKAAA